MALSPEGLIVIVFACVILFVGPVALSFFLYRRRSPSQTNGEDPELVLSPTPPNSIPVHVFHHPARGAHPSQQHEHGSTSQPNESPAWFGAPPLPQTFSGQDWRLMHPECAEWRGGVSDVDSQLPQGAFQSIPPPPQVFLESRAPHGSRTARVNRHHMSRRAWDESSTRGTVGSPSHIGEPCSLYAGARGPISYPQHARFKPFNAGNSQAHSCPPKCPSPPPSTSTSDISFHALGGSPIDTQSDFAVLELKASGGPRERTPVGRLSRSKSPLSMVTTSDGFYNVSSLNQSDPEDDIVPPIPKHFAASASSSVCPSVGSEIPLVNAEVPGSNEIQQLGSGDDGIRNEKRYTSDERPQLHVNTDISGSTHTHPEHFTFRVENDSGPMPLFQRIPGDVSSLEVVDPEATAHDFREVQIPSIDNSNTVMWGQNNLQPTGNQHSIFYNLQSSIFHSEPEEPRASTPAANAFPMDDFHPGITDPLALGQPHDDMQIRLPSNGIFTRVGVTDQAPTSSMIDGGTGLDWNASKESPTTSNVSPHNRHVLYPVSSYQLVAEDTLEFLRRNSTVSANVGEASGTTDISNQAQDGVEDSAEESTNSGCSFRENIMRWVEEGPSPSASEVGGNGFRV